MMHLGADGNLTLYSPISPQLDFDRSHINFSLTAVTGTLTAITLRQLLVKGQKLVHTPDI